MSTTTTNIFNAATMPCLNDTNYTSWSSCMHALLICLGYWGLISGTETLPAADKADTKKAELFTDCQLKACAEFILYVEDSQLPHMSGDDPHVIWNELSHVHRAHGLSTQLVAVRKFSRMEKGASQSMFLWIGKVKAQAQMMKVIDITLPDLFVIVILTSSLPPEYKAAIVVLDSVNLKDLTLELVIGCLLNEEEHQLSQKLLQDSKIVKGEPESDSSYAVCVTKSNVTCFKCGKKGHYLKDCPDKESAQYINIYDEEEPDGVW